MILQETFRCMYIEHIATICTISKNIYCEDKKKKKKRRSPKHEDTHSLKMKDQSPSLYLCIYVCREPLERYWTNFYEIAIYYQ